MVDQTEAAGDTVAQFLGIPFITVCCALAINRETQLPRSLLLGTTSIPGGRIRNQVAYYLLDRNSQPIHKSLITIAVSGSCRFTTASVFPVLDLPKSANSLPILIFPVRLCQSITPDHCNLEPLSVPFERLTGQPLIYLLGTVQNTKEIFCIAAACERLDVQLVLSWWRDECRSSSTTARFPLVVEYAPQLELLAKARLTITHAGLNTVLDSLSNGVPLVAIPITYEQPGIGHESSGQVQGSSSFNSPDP